MNVYQARIIAETLHKAKPENTALSYDSWARTVSAFLQLVEKSNGVIDVLRLGHFCETGEADR